MDFVRFSLENYRRFRDKTSVNLHGPLVAFVGPNEAGKSSLLEAINHLGSDEPFARSEATRRQDKEPRLWWHFQLDDLDKEALRDIEDTSHLEKVTLSRGADGEPTWELEPRAPQRNTDHRQRAIDALADLEQFDAYGSDLVNEDLPRLHREGLQSVLDVLTSDREVLGDHELDALAGTATGLRSFVADHPDEERLLDSRYVSAIEDAALALESAFELEGVRHPNLRAIEMLSERVPSVVYFTQEERDLRSRYELTEVADAPPAALRHLAALADLDLKMLRDEAVAGEYADVATRRNNANASLLHEFTSSWNQQGIAVQFDVQGTSLLVQATTPEDSGLSSILDRSEGMRWFAALLAFVTGWANKPILLADEIETHLHYDAQADLVNVLSTQTFTSKVIYTTHSFGCLPNDLGNGVRGVEPLDAARSRLRNDLWSDSPGFSPLLASMGASAVSFTPSRRAVVGEGACEAILLPTLLRQATGVGRLDFQVVPGLAVVAEVGIAELQTQAGRVAYFVDGDEAGDAILGKLKRGGVDESAACILRDGDECWELEDMVDPGIYVAAVNAQISLWSTPERPFSTDDLGDRFVTKNLAAWCDQQRIKRPDKGPIAQRIVEIAASRDVVASKHRARLGEILARLNEILGIPT